MVRTRAGGVPALDSAQRGAAVAVLDVPVLALLSLTGWGFGFAILSLYRFPPLRFHFSVFIFHCLFCSC